MNTMVAKLMELTNTLFRYRGTAVAGDAEWDEAIRLLLLMLAPAAPHITEELWSRRPAAAGEAWRRSTRRPGPRSTSRDRRGRPARSRSRSTASCATRSPWPPTPRRARSRRPSWRDPKIAAILAGRTPDRIVYAGGGKLVNIVVRD